MRCAIWHVTCPRYYLASKTTRLSKNYASPSIYGWFTRAHRVRKRRLCGAAGTPWTKTGSNVADRGCLVYEVRWNRRVKTEIPVYSDPNRNPVASLRDNAAYGRFALQGGLRPVWQNGSFRLTGIESMVVGIKCKRFKESSNELHNAGDGLSGDQQRRYG